MKILFVTSRIPAPTIRGDQLRAFYQIQQLAKKHSIFLITFEPSKPSPESPEELSHYCERIVAVRRPLKEIICSSANSLFNKDPFQVNYFKSPTLSAAIRKMVASYDINVIHVQLARLGECSNVCGHIPKVIDLVDSLALNLWNRQKYDSGFKKLASYIEYCRMKTYEKSVAAKFDRVITISERDHQAVGSPSNGVVIPNGVNLEAFPYSQLGRNPFEIIFAGNMGYFPNVDGACWFSREVLPLIRSVIPQARLCIVGAYPTKEILRLQHSPGSLVTGWVPAVSYYLKRAAVAICPIRAGSGMQNKALEAMASGCPVVLTPQVYAGLSAKPHEQVLIGDGPGQFAHQVIRLLTNPSLAHSLANSASKFVESNYSWSSTVTGLEDAYHHVYEAYRQREKIGVVQYEGKQVSGCSFSRW